MTEEKRLQDASEFRTWLYAFILMLASSVTVFATRSLIDPMFNLAFEICIFYIPTVILFIIILYLKMKQSKMVSSA